MDVWNHAQIWFTSKYFPNGHVYRLEAAPVGSVTVVFSSPDEIEKMAGSTGNLGYAEPSFSSSNTIVGGEVYLDVQAVNLYLALHEFGHILGLGHVVQDGNKTSCVIPDLMCHWVNPVWPSTLDLYALHLLAEGEIPSSVSLPDNIPYEVSSQPTMTITSSWSYSTTSESTQTITTSTTPMTFQTQTAVVRAALPNLLLDSRFQSGAFGLVLVSTLIIVIASIAHREPTEIGLDHRGNFCPSCGLMNKFGARYCRRDRTPLSSIPRAVSWRSASIVCPTCHVQNRQHAVFCRLCRTRLSYS